MVGWLEPGESYAITRRVLLDDLTTKTFAESVEQLRNTVNPAVARAKAKTGGQYKVESGEIRTKDYAMLITVVVTRTDESAL